MSHEDVLGIYESVADMTNLMLEAARLEDWDTLAMLEGKCRDYIHKMNAIDKTKPLTGVALEKKMSTVHKILADDREIRELTDPWMVKLAGMMQANGSDRSLPAT